jgi:ligand-binding sensor domain-containing protein
LTGKFVNYRHDLHNINSLADDFTEGLVVDKAGNVWIATKRGLDKLTPTQRNSFILKI